MKKKKVIIVIVAMILIMATTAVAFGVRYAFSLKVIDSTIELGIQNFNLDNNLMYSKNSKIQLIEDKIDTSKLGEYPVIIEEINKYGNKKRYDVVFKVVDTTPPKIEELKEIYAVKNADFNIKQYVNASDNDNNLSYKYEGNLNIKKEGKYQIKIIVTDSSGNSSETECQVVVEERKGLSFRNAKWGDTKEEVIRYETLTNPEINDDSIIYETKLDNKNVYLYYAFKNDKLIGALYSLNENTQTYYKMQYYDDWKKLITKKYGSPNLDKKYKLSYVADYCSDEAQAIECGFIEYRSEWKNKNTNIRLLLQKGEETPNLLLLYYDKNYNPSDSNGF